jgi:hypothetical protein
MLNQVQSIVQAAEIVVGTAGTPQERLAKGFKAFRQATILSNDWPVALWEKYNCICNTLLAGVYSDNYFSGLTTIRIPG